MNNSNDDLEALVRSASPDGHRSELIPVAITPLDGQRIPVFRSGTGTGD
ncbi:hypothetical protein AVDCRST_MAG84-5569 [uncultured Microcoleus sp.]|uniref:Uncharacterized protein n=1 Tax=uncultured Microcoleus sp. TaxID=259945 RepID=A0A6J4NJX4_9CYAN|nr:hypothetical protein AVDCRST_MAG84-5569 [uncultured Microcoleus sp.]